MRSTVRALAALTLAACAAAPAAPPISRLGPAESPIATSVAVPPGAELVYVSGTVPDAVNPAAPAGIVERFGDTEAQTRSVLGKIEAALGEHGLGLGDVVMMRVFLVAPPGQPRMDFAGMMRAYRERLRDRRAAQQAGAIDDAGRRAGRSRLAGRDRGHRGARARSRSARGRGTSMALTRRRLLTRTGRRRRRRRGVPGDGSDGHGATRRPPAPRISRFRRAAAAGKLGGHPRRRHRRAGRGL